MTLACDTLGGSASITTTTVVTGSDPLVTISVVTTNTPETPDGTVVTTTPGINGLLAEIARLTTPPAN